MPPLAKMKADWLLENKACHVDNLVTGVDMAAYEFFKLGKHDLKSTSPNDSSRYITPEELADLYKPFIKDYSVVLLNILLIRITGELSRSIEPMQKSRWGRVISHEWTVSQFSRPWKKNRSTASCFVWTAPALCPSLLSRVSWPSPVGRASRCLSHSSFWKDLRSALGRSGLLPLGDLSTCQYNQLLSTEEDLGSKAKFVHRNFRNPIAT